MRPPVCGCGRPIRFLVFYALIVSRLPEPGLRIAGNHIPCDLSQCGGSMMVMITTDVAAHSPSAVHLPSLFGTLRPSSIAVCRKPS